MLGRLFGKSGSETSEAAEPKKLATGVSKAILNVVGAQSIPTMPGAAQKAFQVSTDPNADVRDFIEIIESDEALTARVLKIANSVYFDRGNPSETIEDSVVKIGVNELRCLLSASTLSEIFPSRHSARTQLWCNDIACALFARSLAERLLPEKTDAAFLAGLMHDIGKLLLLQRAESLYCEVLEQVAEKGIGFCAAEEECFPFNHCEVGQLIGERWNFTPELLSVIRSHHDSWDDLASPNMLLARIVKSADLISHALGLGHPKGFGTFRNTSEEGLQYVWQALDIPSSEQREVLQRFSKLYELEYDMYLESKS